VNAEFTFGGNLAQLRLADTRLCDLSGSMTVQIEPAGYTVSAQIRAQKQQVEAIARCLTQRQLLLTGELDARADFSANGELDELLTNMVGTVQAESHNGLVRKFALIGNILAMTDVVRLVTHGSFDLNAEGFPYRTLKLDGSFSRGRLIVDKLLLDCSALGFGAKGSIGIVHRDTDLDVLVAPLGGLTGLIRRAPIIGGVVGAAPIGIPVAVKGDIRDPAVLPLDPAAVASDLTALVRRGLDIPGLVLHPLRLAPTP